MRGLTVGLALLLLPTGCVGLYAEVGAGMAALEASGGAARPGLGASYMFSVGLDSDYAHVSSIAMGVGSHAVQLGDAGTVQGTSVDYQLTGALRERSTDERVVRFGAGVTMLQDGGGALGSRRFTVFDVYVGPGVTWWRSNTSAITATLAPRYLYLDERSASSYGGWGAQARLRYTWLFGDSHFRGNQVLERR